MGDIQEKTVELIEQNWSKPIGLIITILVAAGGTLLFLLAIQIDQLRPIHWITCGIVCLIVIAVWVITNRLPAAKNGTIGFGVAIVAENEVQARKLQSDFIKHLCELLAIWQPGCGVSFVEFSPRVAKMILERPSRNARLVLDKGRCHFLIYGEAKERQLNGTKHVLELEGIVRHAPAPSETSAMLGAEFRDLFPRRLFLEQEGDLLSFHFTAAWIDAVARYIIGIAAMISGDDKFAEAAFLELHEKLGVQPASPPPAIAKIRNRLPHRIAEVYKRRLGVLNHRHHMTRDKAILIETEKVLDQLERWDSGGYGLQLSRAMCHFVLRRDVAAARRALKKCENVSDGTWLWSKAFLEVYAGDLTGAWKTYQRAFRSQTDNQNVPVQCEEFINCVLVEEPEKGQLYFALGLINLKFKNDGIAARRDLEMFLDWASKSRLKHLAQVDAARRWIHEIDEAARAVD